MFDTNFDKNNVSISTAIYTSAAQNASSSQNLIGLPKIALLRMPIEAGEILRRGVSTYAFNLFIFSSRRNID